MAKKTTPKQLGLAIVGSIAAFVAVFAFLIITDGDLPVEEQKQPVAQAEKLPISMEQLKQGVAARLEKWGEDKPFSVTVDSIEQHKIRLTANLDKDTVPDMQLGEVVARDTVIGAVKALVQQDSTPSVDRIMVICWTHQPAGESATGKPLVRSYGRAYYDYNTDSIKWLDAEQ